MERGALVVHDAQTEEQITMLDPLTIPVLRNALDFLFGEGSKILQEQRERRKVLKESEIRKSDTDSISKQEVTGSIQSWDDALNQSIIPTAWTSSEEKINHLLSLLDTYTKSYYHYKEQYATYGSALVPFIIAHNLAEAEDGIAMTMKELQEILSAVFGKNVYAPDAKADG
jgi:hypothetical protein